MRPQSRIVAFHQTSERRFPGINNIGERDFRHIIGLIEEWGHSFRDFSAFERPSGDADVVVSFDDGYEDNLPIIEEMIQRGAAPAVFVPTGFIGKKNDWEYSSRFFAARHLDRTQIRRLVDNGATIGSHGVSHRSLAIMPDDMLRRELIDSKKELEDISGRPVDLLSFPFGRTDRRINEIARECGYRRGFTLGEKRRSGSGKDSFAVPRIPIYGADDYFALKGKLSGESLRERTKDRIINMLAAGTIIVRGRLK